jgi:phage tail sheath gpL-like
LSDSLDVSPVQTITFNEVPAGWLVPGAPVEIRPNYTNVGLLNFPTKALIMGQTLTAGSATAGVAYPITAPGQAQALFGRGSILANQVDAFLAVNTTTELFAMGAPDAAGAVAATLQQTFAAPAVALAGPVTLVFKVAGKPVTISVSQGASPTAVATALQAAVNAMPDLPVSITGVSTATGNLSATATYTARNTGAAGNDIDVRLYSRSDTTAPVLTITPGARANLTGGQVNPDVGTLLTAIATVWFTDIIMAWDDAQNRSEMAAELVRRFGAMVKLPARCYVGSNGTMSQQTTIGDASDCPHMLTVGAQGMLEPPWVWGAAFGAIHAFNLANDPSRQLRGLVVAGLTAPDDPDVYLDVQRNILLGNGISTWTKVSDGTVAVERSVSGYITSSLGVLDYAWMDIQQQAVAMRIRYDWANYVTLQYPRAKLFDDDSVGAEYDGTAITPKRARGSWASRYSLYQQAGWIEGAAGDLDTCYFVRNPSDRNRLDCQLTYQRAGMLLILASVLEFDV